MATATKTKDAIALLKADHKKVKHLFDQFESSEEQEEKSEFCREAIKELRIHSIIEEEIFYPAVRAALNDDDEMNEAEEEHRLAKSLIESLESMKPSNEHYAAKFGVLAESVRHHIKEEESGMLKEAKDLDIDLDHLGERMAQRKEELMEDESEIKRAEKASRIKPLQEE